jgi:hypothetical protein
MVFGPLDIQVNPSFLKIDITQVDMQKLLLPYGGIAKNIHHRQPKPHWA